MKTLLGEIFSAIPRKNFAFIGGAVIFFILLSGIILVFNDSISNENLSTSDTKDYVRLKISKGSSTAEIADLLAEKGIIKSSLRFRILALLHNYDDKFQSGFYEFAPNMSDDEVFTQLLSKAPKGITFTITEGFDVKVIAEHLAKLDLVEKEEFIKKAKNFAPYNYMQKRKNVFYSAEGFLFPDTYTVDEDMDVDEILQLMAENFDHRLTPELRSQAERMGLSIYDLITLASIVEREVRFAEDRKIVAQVFLTRLKINMPLQTDATLQYIMDDLKEDVSIDDTKIDSPYNTYQHAGLPPGPIANPGMESIEAVLNPSDTNYLFFVADRNGHNHYASTYEEHLNLVNQYR